MARTSSKRAALLVASLMLGALASSVPGAQAHGPDTAGWIAQAGDGNGNSRAVTSAATGMDVSTVLYSKNSFAVPAKQGLDKWMAWGTKFVGAERRLFVASSPNGLTWTAPRAATLTDPSGQDLPFVLNQTGGLGVADTQFFDQTFYIYYRAADEPDTAISSFHSAFSNNGVEWVLDDVLVENPAGSVVGSGFKQKILGINQVVFNRAPGAVNTNALCWAAANAYDCQYVLNYTTEDAAGKRYAAVMRSHDGFTFRGASTAALAPAAGWDDFRVEDLTVQKTAGGFRALYSGSQSGGRRSIGWASSTNGLTFSRVGTTAATPATLFDTVISPAGGNLTKAQFVTEDGYADHTHVYISRAVGSGNDLIRAGTSPAPTTAPHIEVASPAPGGVIGPKVPLRFYAGDTLGATPGLAPQVPSVAVDGLGGYDLVSEATLVGQFRFAGQKTTSLLTLADGAHTLAVTVRDLDGETTTVTVNFSVDSQAPNSTITSSPAGPELGFPDSIGKFAATVTDAGGTGIEFVSAVVTNPLGQVKTWTTHAAYGWQVTKGGPNNWQVIWIAPVLDPHFAAPGEYFVTLQGTDGGGLREKQDVANTASVLVI